MDNNNLQAGLINAKTNVEGKLADKFDTNIKFGGTTNNVDNSSIINNVSINILPSYDYKEDIISALSYANNNVLEIKRLLEMLLSANNVSPSAINDKLQNPEVLLAVAEAQKIGYTTNDIEKKETLANLIYKKITTDEDLASHTLTSAIKSLEVFTTTHLEVIAFLYLFHSGYIKNHISVETFYDFYNKYIVRLTNFQKSNMWDLGKTVIANGAAIVYPHSWEIFNFIPSGISKKNGQYPSDISLELKSVLENLSHIWYELGTSSISLTELGKCLGKQYLETILKLQVDYENR